MLQLGRMILCCCFRYSQIRQRCFPCFGKKNRSWQIPFEWGGRVSLVWLRNVSQQLAPSRVLTSHWTKGRVTQSNSRQLLTQFYELRCPRVLFRGERLSPSERYSDLASLVRVETGRHLAFKRVFMELVSRIASHSQIFMLPSIKVIIFIYWLGEGMRCVSFKLCKFTTPCYQQSTRIKWIFLNSEEFVGSGH